MALHLADEEPLAGGGHHRRHQHRHAGGEDAGRDRPILGEIFAQGAPSGWPGGGERVQRELSREGSQKGDRAVKPQGEGENTSASAMAAREQRVAESCTENAGQHRRPDGPPEAGNLHLR